MTSSTASGRRLAARLARPALGPLHLRLDQLADQVAELTRAANATKVRADQATAMATSALELAEAAHHAVTEVDPQFTRELVVATRDEVRRLTVEITEQLNELSAQLSDAQG